MRPRRRIGSVVGLAALVLAGCGGSGDRGLHVGSDSRRGDATADATAAPSADQLASLGACPEGGVEEPAHLTELIERSTSWIQSSLADIQSSRASEGAPTANVAVTNAALSGPSIDHYVITSFQWLALKDLALSTIVFVGVGRSNLALLLGVKSGEDVVFTGRCADALYSKPFASFAESAGLTPVALIESIAAGNDWSAELTRFLTPKPPVAWVDQDPDRRVLDPSLVPDEIKKSLSGVMLSVDFPKSWHESDLVLCPRSRLGWNDCSRFDATGVGQPLRIPALFSSTGDALELWIFRDKPSLDANVGWEIGSIDTSAVAANSEVGVTTKTDVQDANLAPDARGSAIDLGVRFEAGPNGGSVDPQP